jgi:hypothetical protein
MFATDREERKLSFDKTHQDDDDDDSDCDSFADYASEELLELIDSDEDSDSTVSSDGDDCSYVSDSSCTCLTDFPSGYSPRLEDAIIPIRRRVNFGFVQVREYSLTVGSHSAAKDTCPLQLSWEHGEDQYSDVTDFEEIYSSQPKKGLRRLSLQKRRRRIAAVQGISLKEVEALEYERIMESIQEVMVVSSTICRSDRGCFRLPIIRASKAA